MIAPRDLPRLRLPLLAALVMIAAGSLAVWHTHRGHEAAERTHRATEDRLRAITARYRDALRNEDDMHALLARYRTLGASGALGGERRLDWIETLRRLRNTLDLPGLEYEIRPQRPLTPDDTSYPRLMASGMSLTLQLRHEGELVALFDGLQTAPGAIVVPRGCTVERLRADHAAGEAALRANCEIDWVTVQPGPPPGPREGI